jgi:hypothetical protein
MGRWAWKAAAELSRDGPFVRGFEIYEDLPEEAFKEELPTTTTLPRAKADVARAVRFLLQNQRTSGVWDDSQYNYGGDNSLPNVYMADTALAALALRAWGEPKLIETAITRAEATMKDESKIAADDAQEIAWAHAYRLLYFAKTGDKAMMARLVKKLAELQKASGVWQHEYDNPFVTADVKRSGLSFFGEVREGLTGWAGLANVQYFDPDGSVENDTRRRYTFGGAHWSEWGRGRIGVVVTLEQVFRGINSDKVESQLLAQTHVEF